MPRAQKTTKKEPLQTPKGTRDVLKSEFLAYQGFFEKASEIALYYGFQPIETPVFEHEEVFLRTVGAYTDIVSKEMYSFRTRGRGRFTLRPEGTAPVMRAYIEHGMHTLPQPVMLYYNGRFFRHDKPQHGRWREFRQFGIEVIGTEKSVADAMVIKILATILGEVGLTNATVGINSLGDKDCRSQYRRALVAYFKKYAAKFSPHAKNQLKENPLRLLDSKEPEIEAVKDDAPESMDFLSGASKQHFKEVLEYLDALDIPYRIEGRLVRGLDYYTHTVFEITQPEMETPDEGEAKKTAQQTKGARGADGETKNAETRLLEIAGGGRYNGLARALASKKDISAVGGSIGVDRLYLLGYLKDVTPRIIKKPKIFFIQLGFDAKLKSLKVIESLRKAKLPVKQSLSKDSLSVQLGMAERLNIPWVVILGQKEVLDNTVIVRNMSDRSQRIVPIDSAAEYFKKAVAKS